MNGRKKPAPNRIREYGSRRSQLLQSSAVGISLVGYILGGVAIGYLLDSHFRTSFWTPLLLIVGAVGGFRDMIQTLNKVSRQQKQHKAEREESQASLPAVVQPTRSRAGNEVIESEKQESDRAKPRIFAVPPPPQPSFDQRSEKSSGAPRSQDAGEPESPTDLIEKLMSDDQTSSP